MDCSLIARLLRSTTASQVVTGCVGLGLPFAWAVLIAGSSSLWAADSTTPLADALQHRNHELFTSLLEQQADVNAPQSDGMTPLHWAVYHESERAVKLLLSAGSDPNTNNRYGVPPLSLACVSGNASIVEMLLAAGANANARLNGGETVLMTAARTGKLAAVQALIARGADVNARERRGQTALMWAAADGHAEVVRALLRAGADPGDTLESGFTPLLFAARNGQRAVVQTLIEFGCDVNAAVAVPKGNNKGLKSGSVPLLLAIENGHFDLAVDLLDAGADPNEHRRGGYTPLHAMTWVRKPLRGDGDPPPIGSGRTTSLEFVRLLVQRGANVDARHGPHKQANALNKTGATPFLMAAETGDLPLMRTLLELGADPTLVNADQCTPLLAAAGVGVLGNGDEPASTTEEAVAAVGLLLELGADVNAVDALGNTAMHGATYENRYQLIQFLAEHGAEVETWNRPNRRGWTPLDIAYGYRPGNFRPAPESIDVLKALLIGAGVTPPAAPKR
jgi:ankyrin repeat protein